MPFAKHHKHDQLRKQLWRILHDGHGLSGHAFHLLLIMLIILSLALLPLELIPKLHQYYDMLAAIEVFTAVLFTVEYALRIYAAPDRMKYVFSFYGLVDVFSIAPFYLHAFGTQYIRALRLLRIIRVLKLGGVHAAAAEDEEETMHKGIGLLEGERVEYVVTRHPFFLIIGCLLPLTATTAGAGVLFMLGEHPVPVAIACSLFILAMLFLWKIWLDFSYDVIFITSRRMILQNQYILGRSVNQVSYNAITNVKPFYGSWLGWILGYGNIVIETMAAEPGHIELQMVRKHEKAAHKIMEHSFVQRGTLDQNPRQTA